MVRLPCSPAPTCTRPGRTMTAPPPTSRRCAPARAPRRRSIIPSTPAITRTSTRRCGRSSSHLSPSFRADADHELVAERLLEGELAKAAVRELALELTRVAAGEGP